jgi:HAT1-interacting factor 1
LGESSAEAQARISEATKTATDLTGLVRKKKTKPETEAAAPTAAPAAEAATSSAETNGKRKAEDVPTEEEPVKRAKTEDLETAAAS